MDRRFLRIVIETERTIWLPGVAESATQADASTHPSQAAAESESPSAVQLEKKTNQNSIEKEDIV